MRSRRGAGGRGGGRRVDGGRGFTPRTNPGASRAMVARRGRRVVRSHVRDGCSPAGAGRARGWIVGYDQPRGSSIVSQLRTFSNQQQDVPNLALGGGPSLTPAPPPSPLIFKPALMILAMAKNASLTLVLAFALVSKNGMPNSFASASPCSVEITRFSSASDLFPTKILLTPSLACCSMFLIQFLTLLKDPSSVTSYVSRMPWAPL
mmetsp:Transcript_7998/g.32892  ORF Transcript_7998/g.32892 Transcript_7998/m.32892 type:complete len:206 (+) Transcript_7998:252-869(+)